MSRVAIALCTLLVLPMMSITPGAAASAEPLARSTAASSFADPGDGLDLATLQQSSWWERARENIRLREYNLHWCEDVLGYRFYNRAQNLSGIFCTDGLEIHSRTNEADWSWGYQLTGFGRASFVAPLQPSFPLASGARVEYAHPNLTERYENRDDGLEQGFTIKRAPWGEGPLVLRGRVTGDLTPRVSDGGRSISFFAGDQAILSYDHLMVTDADGRQLTASLSLEGNELAIMIEDEGRYPLQVDPTISSLEYTIIEGDVHWALFGWSVAVGDVIGDDDIHDLIVGVPGLNMGDFFGTAYVYRGPVGESAEPDWVAYPDSLTTDEVLENFGDALAILDFNGDGDDDLVVTSSDYSVYVGPGNEPVGAIYIYYGPLVPTDTIPDWETHSDYGSGTFGREVASAGDVGGPGGSPDGVDDLLVGDPHWHNGTHGNVGRACVYYGGAAPDTLLDWAVSGYEAFNGFGWNGFGNSVAGVGDVTGDGDDDILVGDPQYRFPTSLDLRGKVYVFAGPLGPFPPDSTVMADTSAHWTATGTQIYFDASGNVGGIFGHVVIGADFNGDGNGDVVVGAPFYQCSSNERGRVCAFWGPLSGHVWDNTADWIVTAEEMNTDDLDTSYFGWYLLNAGDLDGKFGFFGHLIIQDILIGSRGTYTYPNAFVFAFAGSDIAAGPSKTPFAQTSGIESDEYGFALAAGDFLSDDALSDQRRDIVIGAPMYTNDLTSEGAVFLHPGVPFEWIATGEPGSSFGLAVSGAGDVNGDGLSDVIVGAPDQVVAAGMGKGAAFVFLGNEWSGLELQPAWTIEGDADAREFGFSVAGAGDVNGDGVDDVIIGDQHYVLAGLANGAAFVFLGSDPFVGGTVNASAADWTIEGDADALDFGFSVAGAGDVNGDGVDDVIIGDQNYVLAGTLSGAAFVFLGEDPFVGGTVDAGDADWTLEGGENGHDFGRSVAGAGDVNGDHKDDVIVGDYRYVLAAGGTAQARAGSAFARTTVDTVGAAFLFLSPGTTPGPETGVPEIPLQDRRPRPFLLHPNPFDRSTTIEFELPKRAPLTVRVYNLSGRLVRSLAERDLREAGPHALTWDGRDDSGRSVAAGIYFYSVRAGNFERSGKMVLLR